VRRLHPATSAAKTAAFDHGTCLFPKSRFIRKIATMKVARGCKTPPV
jgi:hypothetical protein